MYLDFYTIETFAYLKGHALGCLLLPLAHVVSVDVTRTRLAGLWCCFKSIRRLELLYRLS